MRTPPIGVTAGHPADNPWVTAVGGTIPNAGLAAPGGRTAPDALWTAPNNHSDAESAGVSTVYPKPSWQQGIPALNGVTGRAFPDIAMDASDGTSQASPTFAGILALATQVRGADLGTVNPALAAIGPRGAAAGIIDVPAGYTDTAYGVTGFPTATGYDIASGWGTISAPAFVPALVAQIDRQHGPDQPVTVTGTGHNTTVRPPVVTGPDGNGTVTVAIDTTGMAVGAYTVTIAGRVLTQTISFQVKNPGSGLMGF